MKIKILLLILPLIGLLLTAAFAHAAPDIGAHFEGERLEYNISFGFVKGTLIGRSFNPSSAKGQIR